MKKTNFWGMYLLLLLAQLLLTNYCRFTPYLTLTILPVMVLCIPIRVSTIGALAIAFASGLTVDFLAEGLSGINALALLPVAYARKGIIRLIFGEELFARQEDFSTQRNGFGQLLMALVMVQALFLLIYIWADGAGTRPLWFQAARFGISLVAGLIPSLPALGLLRPDRR